MTDSKFEVFSATSERGKECIEKYCAVWNGAVDLILNIHICSILQIHLHLSYIF